MEKHSSTKLRRAFAPALAIVLAAACLLPGTAGAIDSCKAKIDKKTGVVSMSAKGLSGLIAWRDSASEVYQPFHLAGCTVDGDAVSGCPLYDPATTQAKVPPPCCEVCIADASGTDCCARLKGCTPGTRDCQVVAAQMNVASSATESLTTSCPAGYKVTGGGGTLTIFLGSYGLTRSLPLMDGSGWVCQASNAEPIDGVLGCRANCCRMP